MRFIMQKAVKKGFWLFGVVLLLAIMTMPGPAYGQERLEVEIDGHGLRLHRQWNPSYDPAGAMATAEAYVKNGRAFVPLRVLGEALGAEVGYNKGQITISLPEGGELKLKIGSREAELKGEKIRLEAAPYLQKQNEEELTYVPLRLVAEAFGAEVAYRPDKAAVYIKSGEPLVVEGQQICSMSRYNCQGMSFCLEGVWGHRRVAELWQLLAAGKVRQVSEPRSPYGAMGDVYDFYMGEYYLSFYGGSPVYNLHDGSDAEGAAFSFVIYHMWDGEPDFGPDSRYLLHDVTHDSWWVLDKEIYEGFNNKWGAYAELLKYESA